MQLKLLSVKEYCKKFKITDAGVRKKVNNNFLSSVKLDDVLYIVIQDDEIEKLKVTIKLKISKIKELQKELLLYTNQRETIEKLEKRIEQLESRLEITIDKKEELYEKVIGHMSKIVYKRDDEHLEADIQESKELESKTKEDE